MNKNYEVAVYYFPQWHADPQNEPKYGAGWSEWRSLELAKPRFPGHEQPKQPLWGELDESDPIVSEKQINAAADQGVTCFLYDWYWDLGVQLWPEFRDRFSVPYYPNASMGWDPSPRPDQSKDLVEGEYPNTPILAGNTPDEFKRSLLLAKKFLDEGNTHPKVITLYAWNEWTEGGYLEPDTVNGMKYLEAIRDVYEVKG